MDINYIDSDVLKKIKKLSPAKFNHTINVYKTALTLAKKHKVNIKKAAIASIFHDCAKELSGNKLKKLLPGYNNYLDDFEKKNHKLWHAPLSAAIAKKIFHIKDKDILNAIRFHTTGRMNMSKLEMVIYLADLVEPTRRYKKTKYLRNLAMNSLEKAMKEALKTKILYVLSKNASVHPNSFSAYNQLISQ